jgi:hypothetical protein
MDRVRVMRGRRRRSMRAAARRPNEADDEEEANEAEAGRKVKGGSVADKDVALADVALDRPGHAEACVTEEGACVVSGESHGQAPDGQEGGRGDGPIDME